MVGSPDYYAVFFRFLTRDEDQMPLLNYYENLAAKYFFNNLEKKKGSNW